MCVGETMKKDIRQNVTLDGDTKALLEKIAQQETDGNESLVVRKAVRLMAEKLGVVVSGKPAPKAQKGA